MCTCMRLLSILQRRLVWHPEGGGDGALWYSGGRWAICCPKANTPADVLGYPLIRPGRTGGRVSSGDGMEWLKDSFTRAGCEGTVVGLSLDGWAEGGLGELLNCDWADSWGHLECEVHGRGSTLLLFHTYVPVLLQPSAERVSECSKNEGVCFIQQYES